MSATARPNSSLPPHIEHHILALREQRVMLDADLAVLYDVHTKVLVQAVKRNAERFPADFMFRLTAQEWATLRSQFVTSKSGRGGRRTAPWIASTRKSGPATFILAGWTGMNVVV